MYIVHIFPALGYALNYTCTDLEFCESHWKLIMPINLLYGVINYYETKAKGKALYWFLTWDNHASYVIYGSICIAVVLVWIGIAKLTVYKSRKTLYNYSSDGAANSDSTDDNPKTTRTNSKTKAKAKVGGRKIAKTD